MSSIKFSHIASTYNEYLDSLYSCALYLGFDEESAMDAIRRLLQLCIQHASLDEIKNLKFTFSVRCVTDLSTINEPPGSLPVPPFPSNTCTHGREATQATPPFHLNVTVEDELIQKRMRRRFAKK